MIKKILLGVLIFLLLTLLGAYIYLLTLKPSYSGELKVKGLQDKVEIYFDNYAIPHIYAKNEKDAFFALGYAHAQERLFQMELLRRVGSGRLSEIFGKDLIKVDKLFRTLGIEKQALQCAQNFEQHKNEKYNETAQAYLNGINYYLDNGKTPIEFTMLGIKKEYFTAIDLYRITGYMSFSFAEALRTDPILSKIQSKYGMNYLKDLAMVYSDSSERIPTKSTPPYSHTPSPADSDSINLLTKELGVILSSIPASPLIGSNSWVIAPRKSVSGKVLFANDTHIGFSSPSVWYEAHVEYPGFSLYGNFLAGFPYPLIGHTRYHAWGMTMFENDDMDLYSEKKDVFITGSETDTIKIKNASPELFSIRSTSHGPLVNGIVQALDTTLTQPISLSWTYTKFDPLVVEAGYELCHSKNINEFENGVKKIHAPGLNVMYGDSSGNIAWWAVAKIPKYNKGILRKLILNGADTINDILGYYDFAQNPQNKNPECGYLYSANNQPDFDSSEYYQGYYAPGDRAGRILSYFRNDSMLAYVSGTRYVDSIWSVYVMRNMVTDVFSEVHDTIAHQLVSEIKKEFLKDSTSNHFLALKKMERWDGDHDLTDVAPTIYWTWLSYIMHSTMADELGEEDYETLAATHFIKNSIPLILKNDSSLWWDNVLTKNKKETKKEILISSLDSTLITLTGKLGRDIDAWGWGRVHKLEQVHAIGRQKPFNYLFNVGPYPISGGNETINNQGFHLSRSADFKVYYGPAMRILLDFADIENSISINPTGESGYFMSSHYDDQTKMYLEGEFREQMMNRKEIEEKQIGCLVLMPE